MKNISRRVTLLELGQIIQAVAILVVIMILLSSCSEYNPISPDFIGNQMLEPFQNQECKFTEVASVEQTSKGCQYTFTDGSTRLYEICVMDVGDLAATDSCNQ